MKKIGLYFGSFNPIHNTHTYIVEYLLEKKIVDEIQLIVSPQNPLKSDLCNFEERCKMCDIVFNGNQKVYVNKIENGLPKPSYTINTLDLLESNNIYNYEYYIIMGMDNWENIFKWKEYKTIVNLFPILVLPRYYNDVQLKNMNYDIFYYTKSKLENDGIIVNNKTELVYLPTSELSSTFIRNTIKNNVDISTFIHKDVYKYIKDNKLYK